MPHRVRQARVPVSPRGGASRLSRKACNWSRFNRDRADPGAGTWQPVTYPISFRPRVTCYVASPSRIAALRENRPAYGYMTGDCGGPVTAARRPWGGQLRWRTRSQFSPAGVTAADHPNNGGATGATPRHRYLGKETIHTSTWLTPLPDARAPCRAGRPADAGDGGPTGPRRSVIKHAGYPDSLQATASTPLAEGRSHSIRILFQARNIHISDFFQAPGSALADDAAWQTGDGQLRWRTRQSTPEAQVDRSIHRLLEPSTVRHQLQGANALSWSTTSIV